jgi:dihydrofolate reductase
MRKLSVFNSVTLDGYYTDLNNDMSWAHQNDPEWNEFVRGNTSGESTLLFGRVTYKMMASFWPGAQAVQSMPEVAKKMNGSSKIVFSKTLKKADWNNTTLVSGDLTAEAKKIKQASGSDMVILGSGSVVSQLAQAGLIDEYQIVISPVVIGKGRTLFETVQNRISMKLIKSRIFKNGSVFLVYSPV